jgi:hypothetical protein
MFTNWKSAFGVTAWVQRGIEVAGLRRPARVLASAAAGTDVMPRSMAPS